MKYFYRLFVVYPTLEDCIRLQLSEGLPDFEPFHSKDL